VSTSETAQMVIVVIVALILVDIIADVVGDLYHKKGRLCLA
jgi:hypothetical protein